MMGLANIELASSGINQVFTYPWVAPVVLLVVSGLAYLLMGSKNRKLNLPPMPKGGLPLLGTMLRTRGPQAHRIILDICHELSSPIIALKTGLKYFIVVTSPEMAYEALIKNSQVYSSRPKFLSRLNYTGFRSVNSALYGPYWREIRKNMVTQVLSTSKVASFLPFREMEMNNLIQRLRDQAKKNDNVVPVRSNCRHTVFAILLHVCFSKAFELAVIEQLDVILRRILDLLAPQVIDFLPFIQIVNKKHKNECQQLLKDTRELFAPLIEEHRMLRQGGKPVGDYVDSLLVLQQKMDLKETDVLGLIGEVLAGGTDTTANTIEWIMASLVQYPEIQAKVYAELKSVVPDGKVVSEEDVEKMPYMHAVVKESLRQHPPLPFGITHGVTEQTTLRGHDIPEDAMLLFHIQAWQNDPEIWDQPEKFIPERFLSPTPDPDLDMTGSHGPRSMQFIPFGAGRRICPGMNLALKHVHLIIARMVQSFEWSSPNPGEDVDFAEKLEFNVIMVNPLHARIKERSLQ
ncbi:unnamed protein product [Calypogeia fissa]